MTMREIGYALLAALGIIIPIYYNCDSQPQHKEERS